MIPSSPAAGSPSPPPPLSLSIILSDDTLVSCGRVSKPSLPEKEAQGLAANFSKHTCTTCPCVEWREREMCVCVCARACAAYSWRVSGGQSMWSTHTVARISRATTTLTTCRKRSLRLRACRWGGGKISPPWVEKRINPSRCPREQQPQH